jgi:hypothetical protein
MKRRALVTLPDGVWRIIDELKGTIGEGDSEVIRNIVIAHLSDRGLLIPSYNVKAIASQTLEEVRMQDTMLTTLVELLDDKGIIEYDEWKARIRSKIQKKSAEEASDNS